MSFVRPAELLRTTSFRIALGYSVVFLASITIIGLVVHYIAVNSARTEIRAFSANEVNRLAEVHGRFGISGLVAAAADDAKAPEGVDPLRVLIIDTRGRILTGSLPPLMPRQDGPFELQRKDGELSILGVGKVLSDGTYLAAGQSDAALRRTSNAILNAFLIGGSIAVIVALGGALLTSRGVLGRIRRIDETTRAIVAGDLSARVPDRGTDDELDHLTAGINDMLDRIQALMVDLKRVTTDVAHDLRTPLARLRQKLEEAHESATTVEDYEQLTEASITEVDRLLEIFTALMRIAEIEARARREAFAPFDLSDLATDMAEAYEAVAEESAHTLTADIDKDAKVTGDKALIAQILANLIENAIRHTPDGSTISLAVRRQPGAVLVSVADDGPGIPPDEREDVTKAFHRLDHSRTTAGNGLGLALVKAVATLHEAELRLCDNEPGLRVEIAFEPAVAIET
ncbi:Sensor kinase CusS [Hartmannibacter diazotrophicus]|uniref:histidine kinase n=1 Tax=Hartmannibacter diazotrophicus TaxID=1482074 RepID=A0A2C9CZP2_9HYPH|nr:HAMP domain-containing sensor histidine kinase [Hartmannibacter diazotrophicus]SON53562.1 Sensor kinase CusS [Hartmannibacter diazotrophicus]